jgi:uncharacterized protein (DUF2252 family)
MSLASAHLSHDSVEDRQARGKAARQVAPRSAQGSWAPGPDRTDPLGSLLGQNAIRAQELLPIRHGRMAASPWTYLRGAAVVMANDLALAPSSGLDVQLCGDAHVLNFGLWATPERNLSFDLRDFDETHPGPFEWDVKRLATSLVVAARENSLDAATAEAAVRGALGSYQQRMLTYRDMHEMDIWYDHIGVDDLVGFFQDQQRGEVMKRIEKKGRRRTSLGAFEKLTTVVDGKRVIVDDPPFLTHALTDASAERGTDTETVITEVFKRYRASLPDDRRALLERFSFVDTARKVVGVGSVGMRVHLLLLQGRDETDPLFLQIKQAGTSVLEPHTRKSRYKNHGERVVQGQRRIQSSSDIFLGWTRFEEFDFYVRQFKDMKIIPESAGVAPVLVEFATACGRVLARAHARSGDPIAISAYIGKGGSFADAIAQFAFAYADQTERDHAQLVAAIADGSVPAEAGW